MLLPLTKPPPNPQPDDPREWLRRARSDLALAGATIAGVDRADLCYHAQQAAEKAVKAVFIMRGCEYPYVHDLDVLLDVLFDVLATDGAAVPSAIRRASSLTRYATELLYATREVVDAAAHEESVAIAAEVVGWATKHVARRAPRIGEARAVPYAPVERGSGAPSPALLAQVVARVVEAASPERIVLFGSGARGTMHEHSDLDLLVVKNGAADAHATERQIRAALRGLGVAFDIVVASPAELEQYGASIGLVYRPALREGRELYRRAGSEARSGSPRMSTAISFGAAYVTPSSVPCTHCVEIEGAARCDP